MSDYTIKGDCQISVSQQIQIITATDTSVYCKTLYVHMTFIS